MSDHLLRACAGGVLLLAGAIGLPSVAAAQEHVREAGNIGVGIGATTLGLGVSGKYFINDANALQGLVGLRDGGMALFISGDYLYNFKPLRRDHAVTVGWYAGFGGSVSLGSTDFVLGGSGIVGADFDIDVVPLDIYAEYRPLLILAPVGDLDPASFGGGVRYYF